MNSASKYDYRVIKSSWGIRISITATAKSGDSELGDLVSSGLPVRLSFSADAENLSDEIKQEISRGLSRATPRIAKKVCGSILVDVSNVSYMDSDFQIEGLSVAMLRWAESEFSLDSQEIIVSFDRASNRYNFEWI